MTDKILMGEQAVAETGANADGVACDILMATYNSARYLRPMVRSIKAQRNRDFRLIIRDDGSSDDTVAILLDELRDFDLPVVLYAGEASGSAKANFTRLLHRSTAPYTMYADADDLWDDTKVDVTLQALREAEARLGAETPIYVHSDARVVNGEDAVIAPSYRAFKRMGDLRRFTFANMLVCAPMIGCTAGSNRALNLLARDTPLDAVTGHDWWMLLVAAVFGHVEPIEQPTMSYRVHGNNSSGPKKVDLGQYLRAEGKFAKVRRGMDLRRAQAKALVDVFGDRLPAKSRRAIERFVATGDQGFIARRIAILAGGYLYRDMPRNVAMLVGA
ncbi:glycosyltransferase [Sphingomonas azotifigens]|uniref:glycosyltransferase n=1 Tax=Sphingomonas azotifigens TaxID=330920 RepID=UPI0014307DEE|nr:glycosyltransferase [Sphingomonas azotifigens]